MHLIHPFTTGKCNKIPPQVVLPQHGGDQAERPQQGRGRVRAEPLPGPVQELDHAGLAARPRGGRQDAHLHPGQESQHPAPLPQPHQDVQLRPRLQSHAASGAIQDSKIIKSNIFSGFRKRIWCG